MQVLAECVGWKGELPVLSDILYKAIASMPPQVADTMKKFYIENVDVPRRGNGGYDTNFYNNLSVGRAILMAFRDVDGVFIQNITSYKEQGVWEV